MIEAAEPSDFVRSQLHLSVHNSHINLHAIFIFKQLTNAIIQLKVGANQYQLDASLLDQILQIEIDARRIEKFRH
jgi:hypothetical protein